MANTIKIKRGSGSDPAASDMVLGEPVLRTDTAELFFKKDDGSVAKVSGGGGGPDFKYLALRNAANNGAASFPNADFTLVTSGTTTAITPTAANTLLVSVNGVIQKPNTGTSTPSQGFALSGSTIKFGANISAAPDFILYQESGGIGEPSDETVSEEKLKVSNSPVNGYFLSAQSGNTGGLTWAAPVATSCTGNSATATALATARAINGVNFDGTAAITVAAAAGTLSGTTLNSSVVNSSLTSLGDLAGLTVDGDATFTGANYNVLWDKSDNALEFADNAKAVFGTGNDLLIYHSGSGSFIQDNGTGNLNIATDAFRVVNGGVTENMITADENGAVKLYHDNSLKFQTNINGCRFIGMLAGIDNEKVALGTGNDLQLYHDGSHSRIYNSTGNLTVRSAVFDVLNADGSERMMRATADGGCDLFFNGVSKLETRVGDTIFHDDIRIQDNNKINIGTGDDLQIYHDGSQSYIVNATSDLRIRSGYVKLQGANGENMLVGNQNTSVELYYDNSKKFETTSAGATITGSLTVTNDIHLEDNLLMGDTDKIRIGNSQDLEIVHDGSDSIINNATNNLFIRSGSLHLQSLTAENMVVGEADGQVELYYDNSKKFETASDGSSVLGHLYVSGEFNMTTGGNKNRFIDCSVDEGEALFIRTTNGGDANHEYMASFYRGGGVELYHNENKKFETTSNGIAVNTTQNGYGIALPQGSAVSSHIGWIDSGGTKRAAIKCNSSGDTLDFHIGASSVVVTQIDPSGHLRPATNNTHDLGTSSLRWANVYTNDLNLSNEGGANDVDGTWGSYTIQEGAEDLFLVNKRNGKKYKFNLTEVL